jgi:CheY-like chemotaxis protein
LKQPDKNPPLVLVAEDDPHIRELIVTRLSIAGYRTAVARDGADAITRIAETRPDAIVLDISMPRADGFEVLAHLKSRPVPKRIPVMVLTARNAPDDIREAIRLGAQDYLTKPFSDRVFLMRLQRLLRPAREKPPTPSSDDLYI